jgi:hypothetical protein
MKKELINYLDGTKHLLREALSIPVTFELKLRFYNKQITTLLFIDDDGSETSIICDSNKQVYMFIRNALKIRELVENNKYYYSYHLKQI